MPIFSVIIPVWHEAARIAHTIEHIRSISAQSPHSVEIIIADGAPEQDTLAAIPTNVTGSSPVSIIPIAAPQGRAKQMNAGAEVASGDFLLFLHADTLLPKRAFATIFHALHGHNAGAFSLIIDGATGFLRVVERGANWRNRKTRTPYGDQAQFFRTEYFRKLGGYADIPLMEDVEIMRRIRQRGERIAIVPSAVTTSARRWHKEGVVFCSLRNLLLRGLYAVGVSPYSLARWYKAFKE